VGNLEGISRRKAIAAIVCLVVVSLYVSGLGVQAISRIILGRLDYSITYNPIVVYYAATTTQMGWALTGGCILAVVLFSFLSKRKDLLLNLVAYTDERGVSYSKNNTYGSADFLKKKDIIGNPDFEFGPIRDVDGIVLCQLDEDGKQIVAVNRNRQGNVNVAVVGNPGTGKSAGYVRTNILQSVKVGNSVVVTDPKGELFTSMAPALMSRGVEVKVFNLKDPEYSDSWDCLGEILDPVTEESDIDRIADFTQIIIENTGGESKDPVYSQGMQNLLRAVIGYAAWRRQQQLCESYELVFRAITGKQYVKLSPDTHRKVEDALSRRSSSTVRQRRELIEKLVAKADCSDEEKEFIWREASRRVEECSLSTIYQLLADNSKDEMEILFTQQKDGIMPPPDGHPSNIAFRFFQKTNDKLKDSFLGGLGGRLQLFQSQSIRRITRNKDIDLARPGKRQVVYFLIIPDQSQATRTLSSMFFNFLFKDLCDAADREGLDTRIPVDIICDEFTNIGMIPLMETKMTICRSRKIGISILFQYPSQVDVVYGEGASAIITGACDTVLFLGTSEADTKKLISERSGEATISASTVKTSHAVARVEAPNKEYQQSAGEGKRMMLTEHEVGTLPKSKCLVFLGTNNILVANKFWWSNHPDSKMPDGGPLPSMLITDYQKASEKYAATEELDPFLRNAERKIEYTELSDDELDTENDSTEYFGSDNNSTGDEPEYEASEPKQDPASAQEGQREESPVFDSSTPQETYSVDEQQEQAPVSGIVFDGMFDFDGRQAKADKQRAKAEENTNALFDD